VCAIGAFCFVVPFAEHQGIINEARNYQTETLVSFDNKYTLQTLKYEEETGTYASFAIESRDTGERLFICPDKYRTMDLKSISWEDGSYTVAIKSGDVGTMYYCNVNGLWVKSGNKELKWSVSKYSDITSRYYEETENGYKAAFYEKNEIDVQRIIDWVDSCEKSEEYYQYIYSDSDSWDMFVYLTLSNGNFSNTELKFFIDGSTVNIFVTNDDSADTTAEYILIRIQAPLRGAWPDSSTLYVDGICIEKQDGWLQK